MCCEIVKLARTLPGIKICVTTAYDWYFSMFLMPIFWSVQPEDSKHIRSYNVKDRLLKFVNGSQIQFRAFDDASRIKGWDAHVIWIEEASEIGDGINEKARDIFIALNQRLRSVRPAYPLRMYVTQNPKGHNWVWSYFIKEEPGKPQPLGDYGKKIVFGHTPKGEEKYYCEWEKRDENGDIYYTIACPSRSNDFIPVGYINSMLGTMVGSPGLQQRMVEGLFSPINELVYEYPIYSEYTHLVDYYNFLKTWEIPYIPSWWPVIVGIDPGGSRSPWAVEFYVQVPDESHWICFDEIYIAGATWEEIADLIIEKSNPFGKGKGEGENGTGFRSIQYFSDPIASKQSMGPTMEKITEWFAEKGLSLEQPKGYSIGGAISHLQSFIKPDDAYPSPYHPSEQQLQNADKSMYWEIGLAGIYYLTNVPGKNEMENHEGIKINPNGHAAPGNIAEKKVYRWDNAKMRPTKEAEEGLSPLMSDKVLARDNHAQTAEQFSFLAKYPRKPDKVKHPTQAKPINRYGNREKRRGLG